MRLYRHYKDKPYAFVGLAKHSETEEEMVIYETRYASPGGRVWVRPQSMFSESVEVGGKTIPRFREIPLELKTFTEISNAERDLLVAIGSETFEKWDETVFLSRLESAAQRSLLILAYVEGQCAGFKFGYEKDNAEFRSWLGAVRAEFRGLGIASDLMGAPARLVPRAGLSKGFH